MPGASHGMPEARHGGWDVWCPGIVLCDGSLLLEHKVGTQRKETVPNQFKKGSRNWKLISDVFLIPGKSGVCSPSTS